MVSLLPLFPILRDFFGSSSTSAPGLDFTNGTSITSIGANAFKGTAFSEVDLTKLDKLESVGADAFSSIVGLEKVTLTSDQAAVINPGVFSGVEADDPNKESEWVITNGSGGAISNFSPTSWPNTTVTVANNLNRLKDVTEINLANARVGDQQQPISTLEGGVLFDNQTLQKLVLPATATNWKLTEVNSYESAPLGSNTALSSGSGSIEFSGFKQTVGDDGDKNAQNFDNINWQLVANILNMFGRVEGQDGKDKNLLPWSEGFKDTLLDENSVRSGWKNGGSTITLNGTTEQQNTPYTKTVNNLTWKYSKSASSITLTIQGQHPNLYRAGYTNNPYAFYQVGFAEKESGKIDTTKTVEVKLTLVGK